MPCNVKILKRKSSNFRLGTHLTRQAPLSYLEVYDNPEDENCGHEVHDVGEVLPVEGLAQGPDLVLSGGEQVEEGNDSALELGAAPRVDRGGREALPDDGLTDISGDEEGDSGAETVALLQELVEQQDDETGDEQLDDDQKTDAGADVRRFSVHPGHDVDDGLPDGDDHAEYFRKNKWSNET